MRASRWVAPASVVILLAATVALVIPAWGAQGDTERISQRPNSQGLDGDSLTPSISGDGRYVAYASLATNLVAGDTNAFSDVFVHDRQTGATTRVSVSSNGAQANAGSVSPSISADGRYVAFTSGASNLVAGDTNGVSDVFVHDRRTGRTTLVSRSTAGVQGNNFSTGAAISADGRYVAFGSFASNLVPGDTNGTWDVFVHDRQTGVTTRVSVDSNGTEGNLPSSSPAISADGRFVAFQSDSTNLVPNDSNAATDVFLHDRQTGSTVRVSIAANGADPNGSSTGASLSATGRFIAFGSSASNLVPEDTNAAGDVFVYDRQTGTTSRVSVNSSGVQGNGDSGAASISGDGRYVGFLSNATNLVAGDTNGTYDIFVRDRQSGSTKRVSVASDGAQANGASNFGLSMSSDGRYVAFPSRATNLVDADDDLFIDIFVHQYLPDPPSSTTTTSTSLPDRFVDIADSVFRDDINAIANAGYTRGCNPPGNDRFCPNDPVTRGQMAAFLVRALNLPGSDFGFVDTAGHVFEGDIAALAEAGITRGCNPPANNRFCPDDPMTRGQMAAFLKRALDLAAAGDQGLTDIAESVFVGDINALYASGITRGCNPPANNRFCPDDPITRGQMAAFLRRALLP